MLDIEEFTRSMKDLCNVTDITETQFALAMMKLSYEAGRGCCIEWDQIELAMLRYDVEVGV